MEARNQRLEEYRDDPREGRTAFPQAPTNTAVRGTNSIRRFNALSEGDSRYAADLVVSNRSGQKESYLKDRGAGSSPKQEKWCPAVQVVHSFQNGLRVPHMEIRFPHLSTVASFRFAVWAQNPDSLPTKIYPK